MSIVYLHVVAETISKFLANSSLCVCSTRLNPIGQWAENSIVRSSRLPQNCCKENIFIMWRPCNAKIFVMKVGFHMIRRLPKLKPHILLRRTGLQLDESSMMCHWSYGHILWLNSNYTNYKTNWAIIEIHSTHLMWEQKS